MRIFSLFIVLVCLACGDTDSSESAQAGNATAGATDTVASQTQNFAFDGGEFQLYVIEVDDQCLDGGLALVFMPEGQNQPYAIKNKTYIPGKSELPKTYEMKLKAPFSNMPITMEKNEEYSMKIRNATQAQVELGLPGGSCQADMIIDADIELLSSDSITLETTVTLSNFKSDDDLCPQLDANPCTVGLNMSGKL